MCAAAECGPGQWPPRGHKHSLSLETPCRRPVGTGESDWLFSFLMSLMLPEAVHLLKTQEIKVGQAQQLSTFLLSELASGIVKSHPEQSNGIQQLLVKF